MEIKLIGLNKLKIKPPDYNFLNILGYQRDENFSYSQLLWAFDKPNKSNRISNLVNNFAECIKENLVMNEKDKKDINLFWGNVHNKDLLKLLFENKPSIVSIENKLTEKIKNYLQSYNDKIEGPWTLNFESLYYRVKSFTKKLPIVFMFYDILKRGNRPSLRVVISDDDFNSISVTETKVKYYKGKNDSLSFEKIRGWPDWHSLYSGKNNEPDFTVTNDHDYGNKLVEQLLFGFKIEYEKLYELLKMI
jgi:hypothetical protein